MSYCQQQGSLLTTFINIVCAFALTHLSAKQVLTANKLREHIIVAWNELTHFWMFKCTFYLYSVLEEDKKILKIIDFVWFILLGYIY